MNKLYPAYIITKKGKRWGYINELGRFILQPQFTFAEDYQANGLAIVELGVINNWGEFVIEPQYESILPFSEGRAVVLNSEGYKVVNEKGEEITKKAYGLIRPYQYERAIFADTTTSSY